MRMYVNFNQCLLENIDFYDSDSLLLKTNEKDGWNEKNMKMNNNKTEQYQKFNYINLHTHALALTKKPKKLNI